MAGVPAFQYLRARYLNPYTATFLTQDTYLGQLTSPLSQNRYTYAHNNPVLYADPSGHSVILGLVILGGILFGSGTATYLIADHEEDKAEEAYQAAVENFNVQMEAMERTGQLISGIYASAQHAYQAGDFASLNQTYLSLQTAYADYGNQFAKACTAMDEANRQAEKAGKANSWKRIGFGVGMTGLGLAAVGFAPALPEAVSALFFNGMPVAGEMAGLLEFGGTVVGTTTTFYGVNDVTEGVTGVNPLRDVFYGTDEAARLAYAKDELFLANASTAVIGLGLYGDMTERIRQNAMAGQSQIPSSTDNQETSISSSTQIVRNKETKAPTAMNYEDAVDAWDDYLGSNTTNINPVTGKPDPNRIFSADGTRSIRFGPHEMESIGTTKAHFHFEEWNYDVINDIMHVDNVLQRLK